MKPLLKEFVVWMENVYRCGPCGSAFEQKVPADMMSKAETALELALSGTATVVMSTGTASPRPVIANLIFRRTGISMENVFRGDLDDAAFDTLADFLRRVKTARLVFKEC